MEYKQGAYCNFFGAVGRVYTLADLNGVVFYVGCTILPMYKRIAQHISTAKRDARRIIKSEKSKIIIANGFNVIVQVQLTAWTTGKNASEAQSKLVVIEDFVIDLFAEVGCPLCNKHYSSKKKITYKNAA